MKIAIVRDASRAEFLPGEEGIQEDKQHEITMGHIKEALDDTYEVIDLIMDEDLIRNLEDEKVDLVFNLCNGIRGEASLSQLPSLLEYEDIDYTGSAPLAHGIAYNKIFSGKIFKASGIATPGFIQVNNIDELQNMELEFPLLVKPKDEGSSRGIQDDSLVFDRQSLIEKVQEGLETYNPPMMVMEYIEGTEFTVGVLGNGEDTRILPILEIDFSNLPEGLNKIYSFEAKFEYDEYITYHIPARIDKETYKKISDTAIKAFNSLGLRDYSRVDIRIKNGVPYVIEINSLPGLDRNNSDIIKMAEAEGMGYDKLIKTIVNISKDRIKKDNA